MQAAHLSHDISDKVWELLEPNLPGRERTRGVTARDKRNFLNAVFWILRTGAPWRDLPPDYGDWKNTHRRFCRWRDNGVWERLLENLISEPDFEWFRIDASHSRSTHMLPEHMVAIKIWEHKRGLNSKIHLAVAADGMQGRMFITEGPVADCSQACRLIEGIDAAYLLADKGYDSDELVESLQPARVNPVIPPRKRRKNLRPYDEYLYRLRRFIENAFLGLKSWRGIATRYAKSTASFLAAVHIRCIAIWAKIK